MNELPSNEHCRVSTGSKEDKRQEGSRESLTVPAGPVGLIRPSVPRASNCRQEIRGTSLSHEGGTGGWGGDKRERRGEVRECVEGVSGNRTMTQRWGAFCLVAGWFFIQVFSPWLTLEEISRGCVQGLGVESPSETRQRVWNLNYRCKKSSW